MVQVVDGLVDPAAHERVNRDLVSALQVQADPEELLDDLVVKFSGNAIAFLPEVSVPPRIGRGDPLAWPSHPEASPAAKGAGTPKKPRLTPGATASSITRDTITLPRAAGTRPVKPADTPGGVPAAERELAPAAKGALGWLRVGGPATGPQIGAAIRAASWHPVGTCPRKPRASRLTEVTGKEGRMLLYRAVQSA